MSAFYGLHLPGPVDPRDVGKPDPAEEAVRVFETGARRDRDDGKLQFARSLSPWALEELVEYMRQRNNAVHRREDNWKAGVPLDSFVDSHFRHQQHWWKLHCTEDPNLEELKEAICGVIFNAFGYLHELSKPEPRHMLHEHFRSGPASDRDAVPRRCVPRAVAHKDSSD